MQPPASTGRIITFYSYKGGTGRTMLLANVAWVLASNGKRVLVVDWDLEAPGLHRYLAPFLLDRELTSSPGVIDMVSDYADEAMTGTEGSSEGFEAADFLQFVVSLQAKFRPPGTIDFVPAGRQGPGYAARVSSFNWQNFYDRLGGGAFLHQITEAMRSEYDHVLIDSRTGVSDTSGVCTVQLPDDLVVCFTANNQSIEGASAIARSVLDQRAGRPMRVFPVFTRVEDGETNKLERARDRAREKFGGFLDHLAPSEHDAYWSDIEVPYRVLYAYEEILACFGDRPLLHSTVLAAAEKLTSRLTGGAVTRLVPPDDEERARVLAEFERAPSRGSGGAEEPSRRRRSAAPPAEPGASAAASPAATAPPDRPAEASPPSREPQGRWALPWTLAALLVVSVAVQIVTRVGDCGAPPPAPTSTGAASPSTAAPASPARPFEETWRGSGRLERLLAVTGLPEKLSPEDRQYAERIARELAARPLPVAVLQAHAKPLIGARFDRDGRRLVTASVDGVVNVWRADGGRLVRKIDAPGGALSSFDVSDGLIALASDEYAWIYPEDARVYRHTFRPYKGRITDIRLSPGGKSVLRSTAAGQAAVASVERGNVVLSAQDTGQLDTTKPFDDITFVGSTQDLVSVDSGKVVVWRVKNGAYDSFDIEATGGPGSQAALSDGGDLVAFTAAEEQTQLLKLWRVRGDGKLAPENVRLAGLAGTTRLLAVKSTRAGSGVCAAVSSEGQIQLWKWDSTPGKVVEIPPVTLGRHDGARTLALSPDAGRLVVVAGNGHAYVHDIDPPSEWDLEGNGKPLLGASFSPDGKRVVTAVEEESSVWIWRLPGDAPAADAPFEDVLRYLRSQAYQCLSVERRTALFGESQADAERASVACGSRLIVEPAPSATSTEVRPPVTAEVVSPPATTPKIPGKETKRPVPTSAPGSPQPVETKKKKL